MPRIKQFLCLHWFDVLPTYQREYSHGAIVCMERRVSRGTFESRTCSKCGLQEERRVGEPEFLGWF